MLDMQIFMKKNTGQTYHRSPGFSLVELMVAMVVGLIIIGGVFSLHSTTQKTQRANEAQMDMVADARFAIEMISYDLRHAGMWGATNRDGLIECRTGDASDASCVSPIVITDDCNPGWALNLGQAVFAIDGIAAPFTNNCITATQPHQANTDILEIRYADGNPSIAPVANQIYIRSNFVTGRVFVADGVAAPQLNANDPLPPPVNNQTNNHRLHAYAYYISNFTDGTADDNDGIPSLRRVALVNGPALQNQLVISGVSDLQVQFGEDVTGDQVVDRYVNPAGVNNWLNVYAAKIWLVMRSDREQTGVNIAPQTFNIAGAPVTLGAADNFRYFMVTSVVNLRNLRPL